MAFDVLPKVKTYVVMISTGDQLDVTIQGHELDITDPDTFRVFRNDGGQRVCVAVMNRQHVAGVFEVPAEDE